MTTNMHKVNRLVRQIEENGIGNTIRWGGKWLYWKGGLYYGTIWADSLRKEIRYRKRVKQYGINDPLVLFQMGKVGSSTMSSSLSQLKLDVPVFTFHTLTDFDAHQEFIKQNSIDPTWPLEVLARNRARRKRLFSGRWTNFNVISIVRLPIYRTVSAFFEHWSTSNPEFQRRNQAGTLNVETLVHEFTTHYFHDTAEKWFDSQMRPVFGIDVFVEPFDPVRGYHIYHGVNARLLVLRLENLRTVTAHAMQEFLNIPDFTLVNSNISETKDYGDIYRRFVETARLPREFVETLHNSRYARHFYNAAELENEARFWTRT